MSTRRAGVRPPRAIARVSQRPAAAHARPPDTNERPRLVSSRVTCVILVAAGIVTFANSLFGVFVFDDIAGIVDNPYIRQLWPWHNALLAPADSPVAGRPVVALTLALNYALGGLDVRGYHLFNITIHILASLVLFGLIRRTLEMAPLNWPPQRSRSIALVSSLLWLVHPLQTEVVNYISQRTESIMGLLYLLTMYAATRARADSERTRWTMVAVAACTAGMATKEVMVTAPLMVVFYDWVFRPEAFSRVARRRWPLWLGLAATWLVLAALMWTAPRAETVGASSGFPPAVYAANQAVAVLRYLRLAIWPSPLVLDYGIAGVLPPQQFVPHAAAVIALIVTAIVLLVIRPILAFPLVWFLAILAPSSSVVPIASEVAAERRIYLPLASLIVLVVVAVDVGLQRYANTTARPNAAGVRKLVAWGVTGLAVCLLSGMSMRRNLDYRTEETIWRTSVSRWPQPRAQNILAAVLLDNRDDRSTHAEAIHLLTQAIQSAPKYARAQLNLAQALRATGDLPASIDRYEEYLRLQPDDGEAHRRVAGLLMQSERPIEAGRHLRETLRINPSADEARLALARALLGQDDAESEALFRAYLEKHPGDAGAHHGLGLALLLQDRSADAVAALSQAVALQPSAAQIHFDLGMALRMNDRIGEARAHFEEAGRLDPQLRPEFEPQAPARRPSTPAR
jgi:Flp pilus assembly protein TadD